MKTPNVPSANWFALGITVVLFALGCERASEARGLSDGPTAPPASAAPIGPFPARVAGDLGHKVVVSNEPHRIVSLLPSHTETLFALGVGDRVVGVDDFSNVPAEVLTLPKLGGLYDTRLESILALRPDLVLGASSSPSTETLERSGLTVWTGGATSYDGAFRSILAIGALVGRHAEADRLVDQIRVDISAIESAARSLPKVRVYFELDATPYAVGPGSFMGVLLAKAGGDNVVPENLGDFPKVSPELVAAADPSVIFGATLAQIAERPGWHDVAAVRSGRVHSFTRAENETLMRPGPRLPAALRLLASWIHPEAHL